MKKLILCTRLLSFVLLLQANVGFASEPNDIATALSNLMSQVRHKEHPRSCISDAQLKNTDPKQVLAALAPYEKDEDRRVRRMAYFYEVRLARVHANPEIKQEVVKRLVEGLFTGSSEQATEWLLSFTEQDFNEASKTMIREAMARAYPGRSTVLICGVANIQEELPRLKELLIDEPNYMANRSPVTSPDAHIMWSYTVGWAARLARARMGVKEDIEKCIELVKTAEKDSFNIVVVHLLKDIAYIRQPEAIDYLRQYLNSDRRLAPTNPGNIGEPVANYVMNFIAESLDNYPIERREVRNYSEQEIELCRKWMSKQTEWKIIR